jgi:hypothetical protein
MIRKAQKAIDLSTSVTALLSLLGLAILPSFIRTMVSVWLALMREDFDTLFTITAASLFVCYVSYRWLSSTLDATEDDVLAAYSDSIRVDASFAGCSDHGRSGAADEESLVGYSPGV